MENLFILLHSALEKDRVKMAEKIETRLKVGPVSDGLIKAARAVDFDVGARLTLLSEISKRIEKERKEAEINRFCERVTLTPREFAKQVFEIRNLIACTYPNPIKL